MKKLLTVKNGSWAAGTLKTIACLVLGLALAIAFWNVTTSAAKAQRRGMTPAEEVKESLPPNKTITTASKSEVLTAVCSAVKKHRDDAAQIVKYAVKARKEFAADTVGTAAKCLGDRDCRLVGEIVEAALESAPDSASAIMDAALAVAPDCRSAIQDAGRGRGRGGEGEGNFENPPNNVNPPPGSTGGGGGGGFDPQGGRCQVCHRDGNSGKRMTLTISCNAVPAHLAHGDTEGPCPVTPTQNP